MAAEASRLDALVTSELSQPAPESAGLLADEIRRRHGDAVAAVIFYGSCLRKRTDEGVLDFYVIVDSYRAAYRSRYLRAVNAALPPNVFFLEIESPIGTLRSKYAVMSTADFERAVSPDAPRSSIWARFCQPARVVWARDESARQSVITAAAASIAMALEVGIPLLPGEGDTVEFGIEEFWQNTLAETYAAEMRPESPDTIRSVFLAAPTRFERAARDGLEALAAAGRLEITWVGERARATLPAGRRRAATRSWRRRKRWRKLVYLISLLKSATTFGDWLPYVLWKLERHTGTKVELSERQRRHPFLFAWGAFARVLRSRDLR
jgi:hypothetical protein